MVITAEATLAAAGMLGALVGALLSLSFSYGRAMQQAALKLWGQDRIGNFAKAQETVYARARDNGLAALGKWK